MKLLLIEDEPVLQQTIRTYLEREGYRVTTADTFLQGSRRANDYEYDCLLVDITLPGGNGLDIIREVKQLQPQTGIIIISAKDALDDRITGLDLGADDYLTKPFHLSELNSRLKSVLRRRLFAGSQIITFGALTIDPQPQQVQIQGQPVEMTGKQYDLLLYLISNKNRLLSKAAIAEHVWGDSMELADSHDFIYQHVKNLRKKLLAAGCPDYIKTRYGAGYLFTLDT
ncbi:DNA-binding response OmpR family regulator [Spirosoma oryzae]|uniref:Two component transcriptional regulator, winged helix family n=2 Tax=Spirosoma TaxID=107 RepID=D2QVS6_SPILD|nr:MULTISPECIES: response regulator transcription factor [Spirosoma]ADB42908.1 two component transcriptional regulator, winged helix family [Spirosoma linguale DSM 74]MBR8837137.1 response regulator transcription factor [Stigonema ocellatum SAG 48.90 = DSM 106950]MCX6213848.1 response regulator transcription factor [Spirosoma sp.]PRY34952.1 DNA-binding response OmpR family regulator [Spirosoma oryzae]